MKAYTLVASAALLCTTVVAFAAGAGVGFLGSLVLLMGAAGSAAVQIKSGMDIKAEMRARQDDANIVAVTDSDNSIPVPVLAAVAPDFNEKATTLDKDIKRMRPLRIAAKIHSFGQG